MNDPYSVGDRPAPAPLPARRASGGHRAVRLLLWPVAIGGTVANTLMNLRGDSLLGILCGSIGVLAVIGLVVSYVTGRKRK